jgi:SRSO17 transposase
MECGFGHSRLPLQGFIGWNKWDDEPLRQELRGQVKTHLGQGDGVLVFDPSGFPKSGRESVGVARQWCGRLGKVDNCQVAIYLGYVSRKGHTLVDTRLYLPKEWTKDKPTVWLHVISLVASSCGQNSGQIEQRVAH